MIGAAVMIGRDESCERGMARRRGHDRANSLRRERDAGLRALALQLARQHCRQTDRHADDGHADGAVHCSETRRTHKKAPFGVNTRTVTHVLHTRKAKSARCHA